MTITRDPAFPDDVAQLFAAFDMVSGEHSIEVVAEAAAQLLIAALVKHGRVTGKGPDVITAMLQKCLGKVAATVEHNMSNDQPSPDAVVVRFN